MADQNASSSAGANDGFGYKIASRVASVAGIALVSIYLALTVISSWGDWGSASRLALASGTAIGVAALGQLLSKTRVNWLGICFLTSGYSLAYFFAYSSHHIEGLNVFSDPVHSWLAMMGVAALLTAHGLWNRTLAWFSVPATLLMGCFVGFLALRHPGRLVLGSFAVEMSVAASVAGVVWCALLSVVYKWRESKARNNSTEEVALSWLHFIAHEAYFVLAAVSAIALPFFCKVPDSMPFWWALEALVLLGLSWREGSIFKLVFVAAMHLGSIVTMLVLFNSNNQFGVAPSALTIGGLPVVLLLCAAAYRLLSRDSLSNMAQLMALIMHRAYLGAGLGLGAFASFYLLGAWGAYPILLGAGLVLHISGIALKDILLHRIGYVAMVLALGVYAFQPSNWNPLMLAVTTSSLFFLSMMYRRIALKGGWDQGDGWPKAFWYYDWSGQYRTTVYPRTVTVDEANVMHPWCDILAYLTLTVGLGVLMPGWTMALGWSIVALVVTGWGIVRDQDQHVWAGGLLLAVSAIRVFGLDLIMKHSNLADAKIACGVVGVVFLLCAAMHAWKRIRLNGKL